MRPVTIPFYLEFRIPRKKQIYFIQVIMIMQLEFRIIFRRVIYIIYKIIAEFGIQLVICGYNFIDHPYVLPAAVAAAPGCKEGKTKGTRISPPGADGFTAIIKQYDTRGNESQAGGKMAELLLELFGRMRYNDLRNV